MSVSQILEGKSLKYESTSRLVIDGCEFLNFGGWNYLALANHNTLREAALRALESGATFSRSSADAYGGTEKEFLEVESEAALFFGTEAAVYLPSGYHLGFAGMAGLAELFDTIILDEYAHWCLQDAAKLSGKPITHFRTGSVDHLAAILRELPAGLRPLVCTDGAFATTGIVPPIDHYAELVRARNGWLLVDESHSVGVVGATGRGAVQHFGVEDRAFVGATLSKGLCAHGAVFVGPKEIVSRSRNASAVRGSNSGSPISATVAAAAMKLVRENPGLCTTVRDKARQLRKSIRAAGFEIPDSPSSIMALSIGNFAETRALQQHLFDARIYVIHSNYIAAGPGGLIRIGVSADHTTEAFNTLTNALTEFTIERSGNVTN